ncbi:hypothetical protein Enr13x_22380 [Stieleria neptunia]|uniref:Uncharacterized protein n=1 Tax=Stieleria neptunia TaxID=2527979 RepID=A0A518HNH2_9BACT|nr:hypothetical protein Enr13x_22380 [Stieleria neptunia]
MSEWVLDDNRSVQTPLRRRGPVEGTKHLRRIADQAIPRRVAPPQSPSPLQLASPSDRTEPSDIAVIPQKTFPEYPRAATKIREAPPLGGSRRSVRRRGEGCCDAKVEGNDDASTSEAIPLAALVPPAHGRVTF